MRREMKGVVHPCGGHSQRGGGEHPENNVAEDAEDGEKTYDD